jgi:hypothetical protein
MGLTKEQRVCIKFCATYATYLATVITGNESSIYNYDPKTKQESFQWKTPISLGPQKVQVKRKVKSFTFFTLRGLVTKNSAWQAKQSVPHTSVTFYCDCMKMHEYFAPNFGDKRTGCCIATTCLTLPF